MKMFQNLPFKFNSAQRYQTVSMKLQDETDEARKEAIEVSARTKEELQPALTAVQSDIVDVKASIQEDQFEHQTKITRLSQEVDTLRSVIHNILSETTVDHFWWGQGGASQKNSFLTLHELESRPISNR